MFPNRPNDPIEDIGRQLSSVQRRLETLERLEGPDAWAVAVSALSLLPGLRGLWPTSSSDENGDAFDFSEQDRVLSYNGNPVYNLDGLAPYIALDGVGDFLSRADEAGLDILGTETTIAVAIRGLSMGGWFYFDNAPAAAESMMSKYGAAAQRSYRIRRQAAGDLRFTISVDGTAESDVDSTSTPTTATWLFAACRFDPSTEQAIFFNGEKTSIVAAVPASIFNSNADLDIGARSGGADLMTGRASLCFLCAADIGDTLIQTIFQTTRGLFGI